MYASPIFTKRVNVSVLTYCAVKFLCVQAQFEPGKYLKASLVSSCPTLLYLPVHPVFLETASMLHLWSPLQEHTVPCLHCTCRVLWGQEAGGLSLQTSLAEKGRKGRVSITQLVPGSLTLWLLAWGEQLGFGSRSPLCLVSPCLYFSFSYLSKLHNEHCWLRKQRIEKEWGRLNASACVSVSDWWLLEYKWDVLIHLNQGHMLGPTAKCSERNEALYCICHSA